MRTISIWLLLAIVCVPTVSAQQARGLYLAVHGPDAPRSVGDPNSLQALYFDIPANSAAPIYVRVFDAETGGNLDTRRGALNTKTRFVILGGASANEVHGINHNPARNRRLTFPASDIIFDETVGTNPRIDGRYWNLGALPLAKGFALGKDVRRFVMLVFTVEGDDANFFDYVLSLDPDDKVPPPGVSMFTYELTLRTPESRSFIGEIKIPVNGLESARIETFGVNNAPMQVNIPFSDPLAVSSPGTGQWVGQNIAFPSNTTQVGLQFQGLGAQNTFSVMAKRPDGSLLPIPLPIVDFEPVTTPRFTYRTSYADTSCTDFRFVKLGQIPSNFSLVNTKWVFEDETIQGSEIRKRFASTGWHVFKLEIDGVLDGVPNQIVLVDSVKVNERPTAWAGGNRATIPGRSMAFDGTVSDDPDGVITRYEWDFGDGKTGVGARIDYEYASPGVYTVKLTVYDDSNSPCNSASAYSQVWINRPPLARITAPVSSVRGQVITFDGRRSSDPDGTIEEFTWTIDNEVFDGPVVEWTVKDDRNVQAVLQVVDNARTMNSTVRTSHTVAVKGNQSPIAVAGNDKHVSPGRPANYVGDRSRDPDGRIVSYEWIFPGDVRVPGVRVSQGIEEPGWHTVYLAVTDNNGAVGRDSLRVRVNHPPVPVVTGELNTPELTVQLSGRESSDADPDGVIIRYDWTMGDGKTYSGANITHTYSKQGTFNGTLMVTDNSGTFSSRQTTRFQAVVGGSTETVAPVASVSSVTQSRLISKFPQRVAPGAPVTIDLSASEQSERFYWFENGAWVSGGATRTYQVGSTAPMVVRYAADDGERSESRSEGTATIRVNRAPEALALVTNEALTGTSITFNGSASSDPDGDALTYEWRVDGVVMGTAAILEQVFDTAGRRTILLRVDDGFGLANSVSEWSRTLYIYSK